MPGSLCLSTKPAFTLHRKKFVPSVYCYQLLFFRSPRTTVPTRLMPRWCRGLDATNFFFWCRNQARSDLRSGRLIQDARSDSFRVRRTQADYWRENGYFPLICPEPGVVWLISSDSGRGQDHQRSRLAHGIYLYRPRPSLKGSYSPWGAETWAAVGRGNRRGAAL